MSDDKNVSNEQEAGKKSEAANKQETSEAISKSGGNAVASILSLKDDNPKVFYGVIAGLVVLLLIMMMSGGVDKPAINGPAATDVAVGQSYVLKSPNSYDDNTTVRLTSVPASMEAYDDTEKSDREGCLHLPQGTPITVKDLTDGFGKKNSFAKVVAETGECAGKGGWLPVINIQTK
jgi:hypothetical protein